jgi:hypothetical protein
MQRREEPIPFLSSGLSYVVMTGMLMLVAYTEAPRTGAGKVAVAPQAPAAVAKPPTPAATPTQQQTPSQVSPESSAATAQPPAAGAEAEAQPVKDEWPAEEVARGREQCMHLLAGVSAEFAYLDPIKKGPCGLPAPVMLRSVGEGEGKVSFDPPVQVNCRMVAALGNWVKSTLQPKARDRLKSEVVRIVGASGYSCRNIYNRPNAKLSQHALANAIDIGGFELENGRTVWILRGWGLTARDIKAAKERAALAAKKKAEGKTEVAEKSDATKPGGATDKDGKTVEADASSPGKKGRADTAGSAVTQASLTSSEMKLGKKVTALDGTDAKAQSAKPTKEALFLRAIHGGACGAFGTVLGPEANDPHRNHFHLDLIERRGRGYCE